MSFVSGFVTLLLGLLSTHCILVSGSGAAVPYFALPDDYCSTQMRQTELAIFPTTGHIKGQRLIPSATFKKDRPANCDRNHFHKKSVSILKTFLCPALGIGGLHIEGAASLP